MDKSIIKIALLSRLIIVLIQFIANHLIPDHNANVFESPPPIQIAINEKSNYYDWYINFIVGGFRRWDAEYFLHITEYGYTYENTLAFYPLYPFLINIISRFVLIFIDFISFREIALVISILLNMIFFINAVKKLYKLTLIIFDNNLIMANISIILFCINPAAIFFTAPYSESLFTWCTFSVIYYCVRYKFHKSILPLCLSILCRSNGILNIGFLIFYTIKFISIKFNLFNCLQQILKTIIILIFLFLCFIGIQIYYYYLFCMNYNHENIFNYTNKILTYGYENSYLISGNDKTQMSPNWCADKLPLSYGYIQSNYWNVGLFNYYEFKQIPNFLLATPIILLFSINIIKYLRKNKKLIPRLGFGIISYQNNSKDILILQENLFVYYVHALILLIICLLYVHIQVSTRMLASSSPCLYWFGASLLNNNYKSNSYDFLTFIKHSILNKYNNNKLGQLLIIWFLSYFFIGTILFCNFLPWT